MAESTETDSTPPRRAPDPRRRSERAHTAILDAAAALVGEVGFAKMTMEGIAARAGVGKQTIYRWWPSKAAVVLDAFRREAGGEPAPLPDTGDLAADLRVVLRATVDEYNTREVDRINRAFIAEVQHDEDFARAVTEDLLRPNMTAYKDRLLSARDAGEISADADLDVAVELLTGPLYHRWLLRTAPLTHAYVDVLVDMALRALRP
jgi:AcrR family transcriptional regulator